MSCERYIAWIEDAAAEPLAPRHEAELNAHVESCAACRALLERERALAAAIDSTVIASVDGQPSPYFAAKVRARIADEPQRAAGFVQWLPLAAGALAVVAAVGVWLIRGEPTTNPPTANHQPKDVFAPPPQRAEASEAASAPHRNIPRTRPAGNQIRVLVAPDEKAGFQRLYEFARTQRLAEGAMPNVAEIRKPLDTPELKIKPIEIAALDLQPPAPADAAAPPKDQPRR